jgi:anti-sigma B factor antagonist
MSSAGLRTLLLLYRNAEAVNTTVGLAGVSPDLRQMMEATGFLGFFAVSDTVSDGLRDLGSGPDAGARTPGDRTPGDRTQGVR